MGAWVSISLIALALAALASVYFLLLRPIKAAPPDTPEQTFKTMLWFYAIAFMTTAIVWGLVDAYLSGYGSGDMF